MCFCGIERGFLSIRSSDSTCWLEGRPACDGEALFNGPARACDAPCARGCRNPGQSVRRVAAALSVAPSTVVKWAQRFRGTGRVAPGKTGGHRPRAIAGEHEAWLRARIGRDGFTLRGLVVELAERGLKVDYRTMWRFVHRERLIAKVPTRSLAHHDFPGRAARRPDRRALGNRRPDQWCERPGLP